MYLVIRLRGTVNVVKKDKYIMDMLNIKKKHSFAIVPENSSDALKKIQKYVTWGEINNDVLTLLKNRKSGLAPPRKGFKNIKSLYPRGDIGYRGDKINELAMRMIQNDVSKKS